MWFDATSHRAVEWHQKTLDGSLQNAFVQSTDGVTGHGYGVGSQIARDTSDKLLATSYAYAQLEEQNVSEAEKLRVEQMLTTDREARR